MCVEMLNKCGGGMWVHSPATAFKMHGMLKNVQRKSLYQDGVGHNEYNKYCVPFIESFANLWCQT